MSFMSMRLRDLESYLDGAGTYCGTIAWEFGVRSPVPFEPSEGVLQDKVSVLLRI